MSDQQEQPKEVRIMKGEKVIKVPYEAYHHSDRLQLLGWQLAEPAEVKAPQNQVPKATRGRKKKTS